MLAWEAMAHVQAVLVSRMCAERLWACKSPGAHVQGVTQEAGGDVERGPETLPVRLVPQQTLLAAGASLRVLAFVDPSLHVVRERREALR